LPCWLAAVSAARAPQLGFTRSIEHRPICPRSFLSTTPPMSSASRPSAPPLPASPSAVGDAEGALPVVVGLMCMASVVCLLMLDLSCRKVRGVGLCGIICMCPGRILGHARAIIFLRDNAVAHPAAPSYEMNIASKAKILFDMASAEDDTLRVAKISHASLRDVQLRL